MIERLNTSEQDRLRRAGQIAAEVLAEVGATIEPGITTADLDAHACEAIRARGARSSQKGYQGFAGHICTSRNDVICHGVPSHNETLNPGDIINVDVTVEFDGFHGDTSRTFSVGPVSAPIQTLLEANTLALAAGIAVVRDGARIGDIGAAIGEVARRHTLSVVREYCGHGIGRQMHMDPQIPHVGQRGRGPRLRAGMAFTIEPMFNLGSASSRLMADGWTVRTEDGSFSAQCEHTILVQDAGAEIMTLVG